MWLCRMTQSENENLVAEVIGACGLVRYRAYSARNLLQSFPARMGWANFWHASGVYGNAKGTKEATNV